MTEPSSEPATLSAALETAIKIAVSAHSGQRDKFGQPYVLHPLRMMNKMPGPKEMMAAVLHDVIEDTAVTMEDLRAQGIPEDVLEAVDCLSRRKEESYDEFVRRILPNKIARRVKLADLEDNMDIRRLAGPLTEKDVERLDRYAKYWRIVREAENRS